jgi:hypothetical protein
VRLEIACNPGAALLLALFASACGGKARGRDAGTGAGDDHEHSGGTGGASGAMGDGGGPVTNTMMGGSASMNMDGGTPNQNTEGGARNAGSGGTSTAGDAASTPGDDESAAYDAFLSQWEKAAPDRGNDMPGPCLQCIDSYGFSACMYPRGAECGPSTACIERHCLYVDVYPTSLAGCVASCLPTDDSTCHDQWLAYVTCSTAACATSCD